MVGPRHADALEILDGQRRCLLNLVCNGCKTLPYMRDGFGFAFPHLPRRINSLPKPLSLPLALPPRDSR